MAWQTVLVVLGAVLVLVALLAVRFHNRFAVLENRCQEAWSNVDTELRRRHELIPNLVRTVQGYAKHERAVLDAVTEARALARAAKGPKERSDAEGGLAARLDRLLAVAEAYPELKASKNFLGLQEELAVTEDRIQAARRFYNANVRDHRNASRTFPGTLFAGLFHVRPIPFFKAEPVHLVAPRVEV